MQNSNVCGLIVIWIGRQLVEWSNGFDARLFYADISGSDYLSALRVTCTFTLEHNSTSELFSM